MTNAKSTDWLPNAVLDPIPLDAYAVNYSTFQGAILPYLLVMVVAIVVAFALAKVGVGIEWVALFVLIAAACFVVIVIGIFDHSESVNFLKQRADDHSKALVAVTDVLQNNAHFMFTVAGRGNVVEINNTQGVAQAQSVYDDRATQTYRVAKEISSRAIQSWNANGGKSVKPKPFSEEIISDALDVGGTLWTDGAQLCEDAKIIYRARGKGNYVVLVNDERTAERMLHEHMRKLGKTSYIENGKQTWRSTPTLPASL